MNHRMIFYTISRMMLLAAVLLILPLAVSLIYGEACYAAFLWTMGISLILGLPGTLFCKPKKKLIYVKEGFLIVTAAWLLFSVIGALPFVISGEIPGFVDAFFEVVSGLTTTGASI
ncbi:MAG: TrkH family potassium uptake protein, partial [Oscillospiraceae bacterium]|nr:TrkH family potassium uptake protein [Oscillospiraceae bacterium]